MIDFEKDELSIIDDDVRAEQKWQEEERRKRELEEEEERQIMAKHMEERRLEDERMAVLETKMMEVTHFFLNKGGWVNATISLSMRKWRLSCLAIFFANLSRNLSLHNTLCRSKKFLNGFCREFFVL